MTTPKGKQATTVDKYAAKTVTLDCGCRVQFRVSPPRPGDLIICTSHGPARVAKKRRKRSASPQKRSSQNA